MYSSAQLFFGGQGILLTYNVHASWEGAVLFGMSPWALNNLVPALPAPSVEHIEWGT